MSFTKREITTAGGIEGWSLVPVCDNVEPLVRIIPKAPFRLRVENKCYTDGLPGAIEGIWVRRSLLPMLKEAADMLPKDISLLVWDAFRPLSVQRLQSKQIKAVIQKNNSGMPPDAVCEEAAKYAADPDNKKSGIPPHLTGGAVDVCLLDSDSNILEMGTVRDYAGPEAATYYYTNEEANRKLQAIEMTAKKNRRILYDVMIQAGFTNYFREWWHFDFGNQFWGTLCGRQAMYGIGQLPYCSDSNND